MSSDFFHLQLSGLLRNGAAVSPFSRTARITALSEQYEKAFEEPS